MEARGLAARRVVRPEADLAVLVLVIEETSHGYEIAERFEAVFGDIFPATTLRGVYKALKRLADMALIECVGIEPGAGGRRVRYAATRAGVRHLLDAVREPQGSMGVLADAMSLVVLLQVVVECERGCLEEIRADAEEIAHGAGGGLVEEALRDARRTWLEGQLAWALRTRERICAAA